MHSDNMDFMFKKPDLLEDYIKIGAGSFSIHAPIHTPPELIRKIQAALFAHNLGIGMDYALKRYIPETKITIPKTHLAFQ